MFTVASYNVLAPAYLKPEWYPFTKAELLDPERRLPALAEKLVELSADILCLQEVEEAAFAVCERRLSPLGFTGKLMLKMDGRPDGCAIFVRDREIALERVSRLVYDDARLARRASGHIAQMAVLKVGSRYLGVANTHLKWDAPQMPLDRQYGYLQARQILDSGLQIAPECESWIVCGDFNVTENSDVLRAFQAAGFAASHREQVHGATCNANRRARMLDFVLHDAALRAMPRPLALVENDTALPGPDQPSDHVPVVVEMQWTS